MTKTEAGSGHTQPHVLVDGAPTLCCRCGAQLCLRKQVINLALGAGAGVGSKMLCLSCLAKDAHKDESSLMNSVKGYILSRNCFYKEWKRYESIASCPDPQHCVTEQCFCEDKKNNMPSNNISEKAYTVAHSLDLRGVKCPMSFVKTKLLLDKLERDNVLEVLLDLGESAQSVSSSIQAEGHLVMANQMMEEGYARLVIRKL